MLNIGWLEKDHNFPMGETPSGFLEKLKELRRRCEANQMRGTHSCPFCSDPYRDFYIVDQAGRRGLLGSAEIWVPAVDMLSVFAAPDLIIHYIEEHEYLPPQEFVAAVQRFEVDSDWDAQRTFERCLKSNVQ